MTYSVCVNISYNVSCFKSTYPVTISTGYLGFARKLERFSQLKSIVEFIRVQPFNPKCEINQVASEVEKLCKSSDFSYEQCTGISFLARQLNLMTVSPQGRRFSIDDITYYLNLMLRSRNAYDSVRRKFGFPTSRYLKRLFGSLTDPGSKRECEETVKTVFQNLQGKQKWCKILADEVHIKSPVCESRVLT